MITSFLFSFKSGSFISLKIVIVNILKSKEQRRLVLFLVSDMRASVAFIFASKYKAARK